MGSLFLSSLVANEETYNKNQNNCQVVRWALKKDNKKQSEEGMVEND